MCGHACPCTDDRSMSPVREQVAVVTVGHSVSAPLEEQEGQACRFSCPLAPPVLESHPSPSPTGQPCWGSPSVQGSSGPRSWRASVLSVGLPSSGDVRSWGLFWSRGRCGEPQEAALWLDEVTQLRLQTLGSRCWIDSLRFQPPARPGLWGWPCPPPSAHQGLPCTPGCSGPRVPTLGTESGVGATPGGVRACVGDACPPQAARPEPVRAGRPPDRVKALLPGGWAPPEPRLGSGSHPTPRKGPAVLGAPRVRSTRRC